MRNSTSREGTKSRSPREEYFRKKKTSTASSRISRSAKMVSPKENSRGMKNTERSMLTSPSRSLSSRGSQAIPEMKPVRFSSRRSKATSARMLLR